MAGVRDLALTVRFVLELAAIVAVGWWGFALDAPAIVRVLAGVGAPLAVIAIWAAVVSPKPRFAAPLWVREVAELAVWLAAFAVLLALGAFGIAILFGAVVMVDRAVLRLTHGMPSRLDRMPGQAGKG